jgi:SRSO17 transposase
MTREDAERWVQGLEEVMERIGGRFGRVEPRRRAQAYLRGLLSPIERKNGWQLAEVAGDRPPDGVQDVLARAHWDADLVRDDLRADVVEPLGDRQAVLVLDETGFVTKGDKSCGGAAPGLRHCGAPRELSDRGVSRLCQRLWPNLDRPGAGSAGALGDPPRCAAAGVPEPIAFATKPQLGRVMLERAVAHGVPCAWVVGDSVYRADSRLRQLIERHGRGDISTVTSAQRLGLKPVAD